MAKKITKKTTKKTASIGSQTIGADFSLPKELKKILTGSRRANLILFDEAESLSKSGNNTLLNQVISSIEKPKIGEIIKPKNISPGVFNIALADSPLDVYRSPFLLDLSKISSHLNEHQKASDQEDFYWDWPGGKFFQAIGLFDFWDFEKSEILIFCRSFSSLKNIFASPHSLFQKKVITSKTTKTTSAGREIVSQLLLFQLLLGFLKILYLPYDFFRKNYLALVVLLKRWGYIDKDQVLWLSKEAQESRKQYSNISIIKESAEESASEKISRLLAISDDGPTIAELLSSNKDQEKFKIIKPAPKRKEVAEKYLRDNFNRRGVPINFQPLSIPWPKNTLSWEIGNFMFAPATLKPIAVFFGIMIALISSVSALSYMEKVFDVRGRVLGEAESAVSSVGDISSEVGVFDFATAKNKIMSANQGFVSAKEQLNDIKSLVTILSEIVPAQNTIKSGVNLLELGEHLTLSASGLMDAINNFDSESDLSLSSKIKNFSVELEPVVNQMLLAEDNLKKINIKHIPNDYQDEFLTLKQSLPSAVLGLDNLRKIADFSVAVMGERELKRYLFVFQNDNEMRATGGFMGSFALVDFKNGQIEKITLPEGGTYDVRAGFTKKIASPKALSPLTSLWEFQDSNWWPDFKMSAENIKWFYEKSGGPTVDGVIAVNSSFFGDLLTVTGPIYLPEHKKLLSADNFEMELQNSIEIEAEDKIKPKKILGELAPLALERLMSIEPSNFFTLAEILDQGLKNKEIQLYFSRAEDQDFASRYGWTGLMATNHQDYFHLNNTNIGGGKTDEVISQKINYRLEIQKDSTAIVKVLVERSHNGSGRNYFTGVKNNSYLRFYAPLGSKLISAIGFEPLPDSVYKKYETDVEFLPNIESERSAVMDESSKTLIYEENNKTVFANWQSLNPGDTEEILLVYQLPFKIKSIASSNGLIGGLADIFDKRKVIYSLTYQKQSGRSFDDFVLEVVYPQSLVAINSSPELDAYNSNPLVLRATSKSDKTFLVDFSEK